MRAPVIAGNWKMYKTAGEAAAFVRAFLPLVSGVRGVSRRAQAGSYSCADNQTTESI